MNAEYVYLTEYKDEPNEGEIIGYLLDNGLKVILMRNHKTPVVAVNIWYKVGSKDEKQGKTGFAHLFEHMMFEGSENVGKAEHIKLINNVGGLVNGSTTQDRTNYWEVVPSNQLELALWLEADRMRSLNLVWKNFDNQRSTVKEERRLRIDNQPYMKVLYELKDEFSYNNFAYKHSVIGSVEDLDNATLDDIKAFHDTYYKPNNSILAIVGDINVKEAYFLIKKYFGDIQAGPIVPQVDLTEPSQIREQRNKYKDPFAPFHALLVSYHTPPKTHRDTYVLELWEKILFEGESSRFYQELVEKEQLAIHIIGGNEWKIGPSLFFIFAQLHSKKNLAVLEKVIQKQIQKMRKDMVDNEELIKAKNKIKSEFISQHETVRTQADLLCMYCTVFNNPTQMFKEQKIYDSITAEELLTVANRYFKRNNQTVIEIFPDKEKEIMVESKLNE
jgi:zinc protease